MTGNLAVAPPESASTVSRLMQQWREDYEAWRHRRLDKDRWIYVWAEASATEKRKVDGDGNFHVACLVDPTRSEEKRQVEEFYDRLILRALDFGGTCTGEHEIGIQKLQHLRREFGESAVDVMWSIKRALDPRNIMNPGKKLS